MGIFILSIGILIHSTRYIKEPVDTTNNQIINILGKVFLFLKNNQPRTDAKNSTIYLRPQNKMTVIAIDALFPALTGKISSSKVSIKNPETANNITIDVTNNRSFVAGIIIFLSIAYFHFSVLGMTEHTQSTPNRNFSG